MTQRKACAFLALWNSISHPALQLEYEAWHAFEHVPERVGLPGFLSAVRYHTGNEEADGERQTPPAYFTCYWLASAEALNNAQYRQVFSAPTPWTARMRGELTDFFRMPCALSGSHGQSTGSRLATLHFRGTTPPANTRIDAELVAMVSSGALVCAHWGSHVETDAIPIANKPITANPVGAGGDFVVMLQGMDNKTVRVQARLLVEKFRPFAETASAPVFFELASQIRRDELIHPTASRQPPRPELFEKFQSGDKP